MKSTVNKVLGLTRKLDIEVPADRVQSAFDKVYKGIQKNATIKGFRKGKAPLATIRTVYGDRVKNDVLNDLISASYQAALDQHVLEPVGYPKIHFDQFVEDGAFTFTAEFEVRPEIELKKFEGLEVEKEILKVEDKQIDEILENVRQSQAQTVPLLEDRGVADNDVAEIDFEGFIDGKPLEGGSGQGHMLEIGSGRFIAGFEEGLMGLKIGQNRDLDLKFPDDYQAQDIAGKAVHFKVFLKSIKKKVLPELNDELAAKSGQFKTLAEFKDAIRKDITESEQKRINEELRNRVLRQLVKANPVEVPQSLLEQQKQVIVKDVEQRMTQQGMGPKDFEQYKTKWDPDFTQSAMFMVQSTFLVDAVANKLNLQAKESDLEAKIDEFVKQTGIERAKVAEFYAKPDRRTRLSHQVTEERAVAYLLEKAKIVEMPKEKLTDIDK